MNSSSILGNQANRPKTSRGKAHPSPDEFFDYVIPSPVKVKSGAINVNSVTHLSDVQRDAINKKEQLRMLGCWLFGSALKI